MMARAAPGPAGLADPAKRVEYLAGLLKGLTAFTDDLGVDEGRGFAQGFSALAGAGLDRSAKAAKDPQNVPKNRYRNVPAYDHSRVHLDQSMTGGTDYVNASWIDGFNSKRKYIATQGPVPATIPDFWAMIWQYKVAIVVKVTREVESNKLKCHRYWPDPDSQPPQKMILIGQIEVEHVATIAEGQWIKRTFTLRRGTEQRRLTQFSYEAWPDHGVPLTAREFLDFRATIKAAEKAGSPDVPVVVHCSAGVGRTGTYILVDRVLECVEHGIKSPDLDLDRGICNLRERRPLMVQTEAQYRFCYGAVLSGIRRELAKFQGVKITEATKTYIETDNKVAREAEEKEDEDIREIVKRRAARISATSFAELETVQKKWTPNAESYDLSYEMTDLESRFVSLAMTGAEIDITPAVPEQIRSLVQRARALDEKKQRQQEQRRASEVEAARQRREAEAEAAKVAQDSAVRSAAHKKALKFIRKKSVGPG